MAEIKAFSRAQRASSAVLSVVVLGLGIATISLHGTVLSTLGKDAGQYSHCWPRWSVDCEYFDAIPRELEFDLLNALLAAGARAVIELVLCLVHRFLAPVGSSRTQGRVLSRYESSARPIPQYTQNVADTVLDPDQPLMASSVDGYCSPRCSDDVRGLCPFLCASERQLNTAVHEQKVELAKILSGIVGLPGVRGTQSPLVAENVH